MILGDQSTEVYLLQESLKQLGFFKGVPDGVYSIETYNSVKEYQTSKFVTGRVSDALLDTIHKEVSVYSPLKCVSYIYESDFKYSREGCAINTVSLYRNNDKCHFNIHYSGMITQYCSIKDAVPHSRGRHLDTDSIGISLDNEGEVILYNDVVYKYGTDILKYTMSKKPVPETYEATAQQAVIYEGKAYAGYTKEQMKSVTALIKELKARIYDLKVHTDTTDPLGVGVAFPMENLKNDTKPN